MSLSDGELNSEWLGAGALAWRELDALGEELVTTWPGGAADSSPSIRSLTMTHTAHSHTAFCQAARS